MKKLLTVGAMALIAVSAFGQGQVAFNNLDKTHNILAIVSTDAGVSLSGAGYRAALLGGPAAGAIGYNIASQTAGNLTMLASPVTGNTWVDFRTGAAAGYINIGSDSPRILNNVGYNASAVLQMVAWTGTATDFASAWNAWKADPASTQIGVSATWTVTTTLSAIDTAFAVNTGLAPFKLTAVPEPSTMALAGLGAAALLIFRRRK